MSSFFVVALFGVLVYFCGSKVFEYMDGIQREEWNVAEFEGTLQHFGSIKYYFMSNLTKLEENQNRIHNLSYFENTADLTGDLFQEALVEYLRSLNESKNIINESATVMRLVVDQCESLVETIKETQQNMMEEKNTTTLSPYNPTRLVWNVYYIYTGLQVTEKCKEYSRAFDSLCLQSKRVLNIQRDFMRQTRFIHFLSLIESDSNLMTLVTDTRGFVDDLLFFENIRDYPV